MQTSFPIMITLAAALALSAHAGEKPSVGTSRDFKGPVGLQLYSLRNQFAKDVPGSLRQVQDFGFKYVELAGTYNLGADQFKSVLAGRGLVPIAAHFPYDKYRDDAEGVAREAKALGLKYAGIAWIPHEGAFDEKECREAIRVFNHAGAVLAKHGLKFFYHNHGYEFQRHGDGTLFDLLVQETDPKTVGFEMDLFWTLHPAQDPVVLLKKYPKRWWLMHLKDIKKGVKLGELTGSSDVTNDVALGTGQMDFPAVLKAAAKTKIQYYFIEDESPSVIQQVPQSLRFLEQVSW